MVVKPPIKLPLLELTKVAKPSSDEGTKGFGRSSNSFRYHITQVAEDRPERGDSESESRRQYFANAARKSRLKRKRDLKALGEKVISMEQEQAFFLYKIHSLQAEIKLLTKSGQATDSRCRLEDENRVLKEELERHRKDLQKALNAISQDVVEAAAILCTFRFGKNLESDNKKFKINPVSQALLRDKQSRVL